MKCNYCNKKIKKKEKHVSKGLIYYHEKCYFQEQIEITKEMIKNDGDDNGSLAEYKYYLLKRQSGFHFAFQRELI